MKDLYIPAAIIIAGAFIGAGLFFGGVPNNQAPVAAQGDGSTAPAANPIPGLLADAGVSVDAIDSCMNAGEVAALVQADADNAVETGGRGTPWSIIVGPTGKTYPVNGAVPTAALEQAIELARNDAATPVDETINTAAVAPVTAADHIKGSLDAPIKVIEYSDFDCPFCTRFHDSMNDVFEKYDDIAWVYRHFPLDQLHPNARTIAQISECVAQEAGNEAFWTFTDGYFNR